MIIARPAASNPAFKPANAASRRARMRGFTLVELLAVIAIIAILVALLSPTLFRAIRLARMASCAGSMHGIFTALTVYAGDNQNFVPTVGAYTRGNGGWSALGISGGQKFWTGTLAQTRSFDNLQLLICPGTQTWGPSDMHNSGLYDRTSNGSYIVKSISDLDTFTGTQWSNYALRWSGWWHKIYPNSRLMLAEAVESEGGDSPYANQVDIHGGSFIGSVMQIGSNTQSLSSVEAYNEPSMNICGSDGRVIRVMNYADVGDPTHQTPWLWSTVYMGNNYFACNDRAGDVMITGQAAPSIIYPDEAHDVRAMSDGPWNFWTTFDQIFFQGGEWPTGYGQAGWKNP